MVHMCCLFSHTWNEAQETHKHTRFRQRTHSHSMSADSVVVALNCGLVAQVAVDAVRAMRHVFAPALVAMDTTSNLDDRYIQMQRGASWMTLGAVMGGIVGWRGGLVAPRVALWAHRRMLLELLRGLPHGSLQPHFVGDEARRRTCGSSVYHKLSFTLGYRQDIKSPEWAAFFVSRPMIQQATKTPRAKSFTVDPTLPKASRLPIAAFAQARGYDRGHLAPHATVGCCREASDETFQLSNICLQSPAINRRSWRALEHATRKYVASASGHHEQTKNKCLGVTVGPIVTSPGVPHVSKPLTASAFFMAVYDVHLGEGFGFIVSQAKSSETPSVTQYPSLCDLELAIQSRSHEGAARPIFFPAYRDDSQSFGVSMLGSWRRLMISSCHHARVTLCHWIPWSHRYHGWFTTCRLMARGLMRNSGDAELLALSASRRPAAAIGGLQVRRVDGTKPAVQLAQAFCRHLRGPVRGVSKGSARKRQEKFSASN